MKWVELTKFFPPEPGGIERVSLTTARLAHASGLDVSVVAFSAGESSFALEAGVGDVRRWKTQVKVASAPLSVGYLRDALRMLSVADIVHVHMPNPLAALAVCLSRGRFRTIVHWHSDVVAQRRLYVGYRPLETRVLRRAERIVVTSDAYADASLPLRQWRSKCVTIPLSTDFAAGPAVTVPGRLVACGRLVPYKGFDVMVRAMAELPECELHLCGRGPQMDSLQELANRIGVQDRVRFLGFVDDVMLARTLASADVFCMPSVTRAEAFGVSVIEAFAAGVPVVSSALDGSGLATINRHGLTGLQFETGNHVDLARAISEIVSDRQRRDSMAAAARTEFSSCYNEDAYGERFGALIRALAPEAPSR
ncbi:hypothetical protein N790_07075 [Arenimonas malthae CC-JY-1]|uniref:Glycosyltransferase subfamily 4-like N-terminal domain-containing protein n=1 Tax=Arenimonas malthae CC-JY-1 TaxID=1384054 RepID=A0A091BAQ6_9GAMM|nr:glycosyltransferase [Arenimonas malthae]KFN47904.1 hypothetical protein N790_07075 [Arenimonas malthae CC-JY-1]